VKTLGSYTKRLIVLAAVFIIGVLPVFISNTLSNAEYSAFPDNGEPVDSLTGAEYKQMDQPGQAEHSSPLYPSDIIETENRGIRQVIKVYELGVYESPNNISKEPFDIAGWRYEFMDITKKEIEKNITRESSIPVCINSETKDIDVIINQLAPMLQYSSPDEYAGLLSLDITSITVEAAADESEFDPDAEPDLDTSTEQDSDLPSNASYYRIEAVYRGTLSKLLHEKTVYSIYFTGVRITPAPMPETPVLPELPTFNNKPIVSRVAVISTCFSIGVCLFLFYLYRGNVKVYNSHEDAYILLGEARVGFTYPVINLTPYAGKAVTGNFVLILNRNLTKQLSDKTVTINYGGKNLQHIVEYNGGDYYLEVNL